MTNQINKKPTPEFELEKDVFIINDINLKIPPTNINIQREDLIYSWKSLRTKSSTKIPSGHGHMAVQVVIPFKESQFIEMHRLIIQLKNNPFCHIENAFLRESLVPEWPDYQNMAFTMTAMNLAPITETSDVWVMQLELLWFNYTPYTHNWLYRTDWATDWINVERPKDETDRMKFTIGWDTDPNSYEKTHRANPIAFSSTDRNIGDGAERHRMWSVRQQEYRQNEFKTIREIAQNHHGEIFDLAPMPTNMERSKWTPRASQSRIYVRYINFLQRDALIKNFGYDPEARMNELDESGKLASFYFSQGIDNNGRPVVYSLHRGGGDAEMRRMWRVIRNEILSHMNRHHDGVQFRFCSYEDIRLPQNLAEVMRTVKLKAKQRLYSELGYDNSKNKRGFVEHVEDGEIIARERVRFGWTNPEGKHVPVGNGNGQPATIGDVGRRLRSGVKYRSSAKLGRLYSSGFKKGRMHYGVDIASIEGCNVYAVAPVKSGGITIVDNYGTAGKRWRLFDIQNKTSLGYYGFEEMSEQLAAFEELSKIPLDSLPVGAMIAHPEEAHKVFIKEYSDGGQYVKLKHDDGISFYMHLSEISQELKDKAFSGEPITIGEVAAGFVIGKTGSTGPYNVNWIERAIVTQDAGAGLYDYSGNVWARAKEYYGFNDSENYYAYKYPTSEPSVSEERYGTSSIDSETLPKYQLSSHLHFEYWEFLDLEGASDPDPPKDGVKLIQRRKYYNQQVLNMVPVDITESIALASKASSIFDVSVKRLTDSVKELEAQLESLEEGSDDDNSDLKQVLQIILGLAQDGWFYYQEDSSITNVWWKPFTLDISAGNPEIIKSSDPLVYFQSDDIVLTAVGGGLRHVVANIPLLGSEYPTQQHLGSVEPYYSFEFAALDQSNSLKGIGKPARQLMAMRELLHRNARKFRPIMDGWACSGATFITRLLGSFEENDVLEADIQSDIGNRITTDFILKRRLAIARVTSETMEGQPGVSIHNFELSETNPYEEEKLTSNAPDVGEKDKIYSKILNAVYSLNFDDKYRDKMISLFVARLAGFSSESMSGSRTINSIDTLDELNLVRANDTTPYVLRGQGDNPALSLVVKNTNGYMSELFNQANLNYQRYSVSQSNLFSDATEEEYIVVDFGTLESVGLKPQQESITRISKPVVNKDSSVNDKLIYVMGYQYKYKLFSDTVPFDDLTEEEKILLDEIPVEEIIDYHRILRSITLTSELMVSEHFSELDSGVIDGNSPLTKDAVREELYGLPVEPCMWRAWQLYLLLWGSSKGRELNKQLTPQQIIKVMTEVPNWLTWRSELYGIPKRVQDHVKNLTLDSFSATNLLYTGIFSQPTNYVAAGLFDTQQFVLDTTDGIPVIDTVANWYLTPPRLLTRFFLDARSQSDADISGKSALEAVEDNSNLYANILLTQGYMHKLPLALFAADDRARGMLESYGLGNLFTNELIGENKLPVLASTENLLVDSVLSSGLFTLNAWTIGFNTDALAALEYGFYERTDPEQITVRDDRRTEVSEVYERPNVFNTEKPGSPWVWKVNEGLELRKIRYFKQLLSRLAREILNRPGVLKAFGLEELSFLDQRGIWRGMEAYPDLDLPTHPYFGNTYKVTPDFYMWNMYEDGEVFSQQFQEELRKNMDVIVENCYESLQEQQKGKKWNPRNDEIITEPGVDVSVDMIKKFHAEGSDNNYTGGSDYGPMASPFYTDERDTAYIEKFVKQSELKYEGAFSSAEGLANAALVSGSPALQGAGVALKTAAYGYNYVFSDQETKPHHRIAGSPEFPESLKPPGVRLSLEEGYYGLGGGINYPTKVDPTKYKELQDKVNGITRMFGSRAGFLNISEVSPEIEQETKETRLHRLESASHRFDKESLKLLAWQSSTDIVSEKMTLRRAFPTFKLYFVEEDEYENRLLNFDDFYSYNGVVSFTFVSNRKSAADHAVITIQNIAGTLDGTKRNAVVDTDYFSRERNLDVDDRASFRGQDPITQGSAQDQPFGAVILRPGLNIQLRMGYSNDPSNLSTIINGRVVDVQWNKQGDTAEIMVQSFGTELLQDIKGLNQLGSGQTFYTTHQLLGAMMLEPEIRHFGRWEFGSLTQYGENSDYALDFTEYSREGHLGRFQATSSITNWILDNKIIVAAIAIGGSSALNAIPGVGRLLGRFGTGIAGKTIGKTPVLKALLPGIGDGLRRSPFKKALARAVRSRTGQKALKNAQVTTEDIRIALKAVGLDYDSLRVLLSRGGKTSQFADEVIDLIKKDLDNLAANPAGSFDDVVSAYNEIGWKVTARTEQAMWFAKPVVDPVNGSGLLFDIGGRPIINAWTKWVRNVPKILAAGFAGGLVLDTLNENLLYPIYKDTILRLQKYFQATKSRLFLNPQDDNLFPPHPKDYMNLEKYNYWEEVGWWMLKGTIATGLNFTLFDAQEATEAADTTIRWFRDDLLDKRVEPEACHYMLAGSRIWDIFHEMSLRHPGWVYGARPYGHEFRYTMFFGVPSQRYWARGANNQFIYRSNRLADALIGTAGQNSDKIIATYRGLYGNKTRDNQTVDDRLEEIRSIAYHNVEESKNSFVGPLSSTPADEYNYNDTRTITNSIDGFRYESTYLGEPAFNNDQLGVSDVFNSRAHTNRQMSAREEEIYENIVTMEFRGRILEEYLNSIELRFLPFRRYHSITSERDIVWNGIINSENAVYNAVDVTYFDFSDDENAPPKATSLFKAHSHLPDYRLRILPLSNYRNCRGYNMAMRYGLGALCMGMRDMYRGEIMLLGNPRIRPWDICIMVDSYNDMVGPIEVEQVVHSFSHETGFITEIKPSAVVFANEISSWPVMEAAKIATMAVKESEETRVGLRAEDAGGLLTMTEWILNWGNTNDPDYVTHIKAEMKKVFGDGFDVTQDVFGGDPPDLESLTRVGTAVSNIKTVVTSGLAVTAAVGVGILSYKGGGLLMKNSASANKTLLTKAGLGLVGGASIIGLGEYVGSSTNFLDMPHTIWLLGGPILLLSALKNDSIILVPLVKSGHPIVSGLNYNDPSMLWKNFKGDLANYVDDTISGTRDLLDLWSIYGMHAWRRVATPRQQVPGLFSDSSLVDANDIAITDLTGE